jgi:hypothetical protein
MNFLFVVLTVTSAQSLEYETAQVQALLRARSLNSLNSSISLFQEIETAQQMCTARLVHKEFPIECYRLLALEKNAGLKPRNFRQYDDACRKAFISGQEIMNLEFQKNLLSPNCRSYVHKANCKKIYQMGLFSDDCEPAQ